MKLAIKITFWQLLFFINIAFGQHFVSNQSLNENEQSLLELISKDTVNPLQIKLDGEFFKFGIKSLSNTKLSLLKNKKDIFIQPLGTGKLYKVIKEQKGGFQLQRIDSTYFNGANFNAINFFMNDTLFQFGGDGYWHIRGIVTYFSQKTHEWELYNANRLVIAFEDINNNLVYYIDRAKNNLYISNAFSQVDFPVSLNVKSVDSVYKFNTQSHEWTNLGQSNPTLKAIIEAKGLQHYQMNEFSIIQDKLELYWVNFDNNSFGKFNNQANREFKDSWLSIYLNNTKHHVLPFILGNTLYLTKIDANNKFSFTTFEIKKDAFDFKSQQPVYFTTNIFLQFISIHWYEILFYLFIILIIMGLAFFWLKGKKKKNTLHKEVSTILNNHFFESLTIIEKELIEVLYEHHQKGTLVSTKLINKIIGVQNKDVMTQNKNRSDYFLKINQKFKFATHKELPLIIKTRDQIDKRQFNYGIQEAYRSELALMIKK